MTMVLDSSSSQNSDLVRETSSLVEGVAKMSIGFNRKQHKKKKSGAIFVLKNIARILQS
jgi:hypothetical protein